MRFLKKKKKSIQRGLATLKCTTAISHIAVPKSKHFKPTISSIFPIKLLVGIMSCCKRELYYYDIQGKQADRQTTRARKHTTKALPTFSINSFASKKR